MTRFIVSAIVFFCALAAGINAQGAEAFSDPNMFLQTSIFYGGSTIDAKSNGGESKISSQSQPAYGARVQVQYWYHPVFTFTGGLALEQSSYLIRHDLPGARAEFEESVLLMGFPVGMELNLLRSKHLYFPVLFVPKLKLSENVTVKSCTGLCRAENTMNSWIYFAEFGAGWIQGNWDFQLLAVQSLSKQFNNDTSDLRISGLKFLAGYVW